MALDLVCVKNSLVSVNTKVQNIDDLSKSLYTLLKLAQLNIRDHDDGITSPGISTKEQAFTCKGWTPIFQHVNELKHEPLHSDIHLYFCGMCGQSFTMEENLDGHLQPRRKNDKNKTDENMRKTRNCQNTNSKEDDMITLFIPVVLVVKQLKRHENKSIKKKSPKNQINENRCKKRADKNKPSVVNKALNKFIRKAKCPIPALPFFNCSKCGERFSKKTSLKIHELKHKRKHPYQCNQCTDRPLFQTRMEYISHSQKLHQSLKNTKEKGLCEICGQLFKSKDVLRDHMNTHNPDRPKPHVCLICKKKFPKLTVLRSHQRIHSGETPFLCQICGKAFTWKSSLRRHMERHSNVCYSCDICGQKFRDKSNKSRHMLIHSGFKPFSCDVCGKPFRLKYNLVVHLKTHTKEQISYCTMCGKHNCKCDAMSLEMTCNKNGQACICDQCGKSFVLKKMLKQHQAIHTGEKLKCYLCDLEFQSRQKKREHMTVAHNWQQVPIKIFKCEHCDKIFQNKLCLRSHYQVHNKDTIYKCTKCHKLFNRPDSFKVHQKLHLTEENHIQYLCIICSKRFKALKYVRGHIRSIHPIDYSKSNQTYKGLYEIVRKDQSLLETSTQIRSNPNAEVKNDIHFLQHTAKPNLSTEDLGCFQYHILS